MMIDRATLRHFGLPQRGHYRSRLHEALEHELVTAIDDRALVAVCGEFGAGKTTLVDGALRLAAGRGTRPLQVVRVQDPHRERQKVSHVMNAAIYDLSTENPRRDAEARARQFARVVGERVVRQGQRVVIVVENAHRLHPHTLMALKDAREIGFAAEPGPLYSIVLVGQGRLREMLERQPEIGHRTTIVEMTEEAGWMTQAEREHYLEAVYARAIEPATRQRLAVLYSSPLALDAAVARAMRDARRAGYCDAAGSPVVDERVVPLPLEQLVHVMDGISYAEIGREAGLPKSTVADAIRRGDSHHASPAVREAIERLRARAATSRAA